MKAETNKRDAQTDKGESKGGNQKWIGVPAPLIGAMRIMKHFKIAALCFGILTLSLACASKPESPFIFERPVQCDCGPILQNCSVILKFDKTRYAAGSAVKLSVHVKNIGASNLAVRRAAPLTFSAVKVVGPGGADLPLTESGKQIEGIAAAWSLTDDFAVDPGEDAEADSFNVADLYDLSRLGEYRVVVAQQVTLAGKTYNVCGSAEFRIEKTEAGPGQ